ncbi:hypothetical protein D9619_006691 [Psilocybe cf. subviscida]|uniref:AA9 family lytic polysaccharide monooxygenase n=1 Tax=Psilocybe cf. subviscida TaxID=2480587 RepID=A0A8H5B4D4_9AGAR|nr:hypothetical protein D9619_006691 [Psilocybe cf. subviscida]
MLAITSLAVALCAAKGALAHGGVLFYSISGTQYQGVVPYNSVANQVSIQRPWYTYDPILNSEAATLACNNYGESLTGASQLTATVKAGSAITACAPDPLAAVLTQPRSNGRFKIDEAGLLSGTVATGFWAADKMIQQNSTWTTTIPSSVPSGNYLIRFETIALHSLPAQHYPECAQITITDGGSLAPTAAQLVTFPGGYKNTDPGLTVDVYGQAAKTATTYVIPGPPLYSGSGSGSTTKPASSTTVVSSTTKTSTTVISTTKPATTTVVSTTKTSSSATPSATGTAAQYGQCGGIGYTGPTVCASPYTCKKTNDYYSQCL